MKKFKINGITVCTFIIFASLLLGQVFVFADNGKECTGISKERIESSLKKINVHVTAVLSIAPSPLDGICEIGIEDQGKVGVFYTDSAFNYLLFGQLIEATTMINLTATSAQNIRDQKRIDLAKISLNEALILGGKNAEKKVIVFTDPD